MTETLAERVTETMRETTAETVTETMTQARMIPGSTGGKTNAGSDREIDRMLERLREAGERVPPRAWIKTPAQIEGCREAGRVNSAVLDAVAKEIRAGMTTAEIDRIVRRETKALGGICACLGYEGFPAAVCVSVNNEICHGIPSEACVLKEGDIVNVDCTTVYGGYFGDASRMFEIGEVSENAHALVKLTREAVETTVSHLAPFASHLGDIGYGIATAAKARGYTVVREIGGHGVGLEMHEDPYVCHVGLKGQGKVLVPGMIFTVEPMINEGKPHFTVDKKNGWTVRTADGKLSAQVEYEVLITEDGHEILSR